MVRNRTICVAVHHVRLDWPLRNPENGRYFADSLIGPAATLSPPHGDQAHPRVVRVRPQLDSEEILGRRPCRPELAPRTDDMTVTSARSSHLINFIHY